jgi:hypothetical protein
MGQPQTRCRSTNGRDRTAGTSIRAADKSVLERDDDDVLRPVVGLLSGILAGFIVWSLLGVAVLAVYQFTLPWAAATVQKLLLAAE